MNDSPDPETVPFPETDYIAVVRAVEALLDDSDQLADTPDTPNMVKVWGVRQVLAQFGGKPHRWPFPCVECSHFASHEDGCTECDCMLTDREAASGRDEALDDAIVRARWEQAVADGEPWATDDATRSGGQVGQMTDPYGKDFQ